MACSVCNMSLGLWLGKPLPFDYPGLRPSLYGHKSLRAAGAGDIYIYIYIYTTQCNATQHNTTQCNSVTQYNAMQCNTITAMQAAAGARCISVRLGRVGPTLRLFFGRVRCYALAGVSLRCGFSLGACAPTLSRVSRYATFFFSARTMLWLAWRAVRALLWLAVVLALGKCYALRLCVFTVRCALFFSGWRVLG